MTVSIATNVAEATELLAGAPSPVVIIAVYDAYGDVVCCLEAVDAHTSPETSVLVVDDGGSDRRIFDLLDSLGDGLHRQIVVLQRGANGGFVRACNDAFAATPGRDVVVLNSDVVVGPEWLDRLTDAALSLDTIATASTLTNHGTILSVPHRNRPATTLLEGLTADDAARRVAAASQQLRPTIPTAIGHCFYIRRRALDLVGPFDVVFDPGYGEEVDFSQRALAHGFRHIVADDVFTFHRGGRSFGESAVVTARRARHEALVKQRYPWYGPAVRRASEDHASRLSDALATARRALVGLVVGIDGLSLGPHLMGTQRIVVESIRALARRKEIARLVVFVPPGIPPYVEDLRDELPLVEFIGINPFMGMPEQTVDVIYRPCQVSQLVDLHFLSRAGERFVINQLDTIAFENPSYFESDADWVAYRDLTRLTFELADGVAFLSERSRRGVDAEGLLGRDTPSAVVSCGIDDPPEIGDGDRPAAFARVDAPFVLCIGASYLHKNRRFAIEVFARLRDRGWPGVLTLCGPTPPDGNSLASEAEFLLRHPDLRPHVMVLGAVSEREKHWLYRHAALVLYPSTVEGFGLVPFEAARSGVPTLASRQGSLEEVLPPDIPVLDGFEVDAGAEQAWRLLHDPAAAETLTEALRSHSRQFTWDATAERLLDLFGQALARPRNRVLVLDGEGSQPIGLAPRTHHGGPRHGEMSSALNVERFVQAVLRRPNLKQRLSPNGSRRQQAARRVISRTRRRHG
jgi:glycosyltransferase involved in cell wall biosynthesis/GT2 family glycosyltransferase